MNSLFGVSEERKPEGWREKRPPEKKASETAAGGHELKECARCLHFIIWPAGANKVAAKNTKCDQLSIQREDLDLYCGRYFMSI